IPMTENQNGSPYIKVILPGNRSVNALIDLGCNKSVVLTKKLYKEVISASASQQSMQKILTTGYESNCWKWNAGRLACMNIGSLRSENVPVLSTESNYPMIIGNQFLENYIIIFDFADHQLIFIPEIQPKPVLYEAGVEIK